MSGRFGVDTVVYFADVSGGMLATEQVTRTNGASGFGSRVRSQRSLHLKLPVQSTVVTVLYPVKKDQPTPRFEKEADGVVKIESDFGTDSVFLGLTPFDFREGEVAFHGKAGAVQWRPAGPELSLAGFGELRCQNRVLTHASP